MTSPLLHGVRCLILLLSLMMTSGNLHAHEDQSLDSIEARVDQIFSECDQPGSPGAAVAILRNGQVVLSKGYGSAQLEYNIPITPATVFRIASMSKQFTAMAITMLEEEGRLSIEDDVHVYLPELPDFEEPIAIRHLLHHTSGLRDDLTLWILAGHHIEDVVTQEDLLALVWRQKQLNFSPGSQYGYSDTNYDLLAEIVSRVTGESFASWVKKNIFFPLGMTSSRFLEHYAEPVEHRACSYERTDAGGFKNVLLSMEWYGSSGLHTTVEDMTHWLGNFETGEVGGGRVLGRMLTRGVLDNGDEIHYARGLNIDRYHDRKVIRHSGTNGGFFCHMSYFPDERLGVVVLSNFPSNPWDLVEDVAGLFLKPGPDEPSDREPDESDTPPQSEPAAVSLNGDQISACTGTYWYEESWNWLVRDIVVEDGTLYYVRSTDSRSELTPLSAHEFLLAGTDNLIVRFSDSVNGRFTHLAFNANGEKPSHAIRVECLEPGRDALREYEGLYYAEELDALHRLVVRGEGLFNVKFRYEPSTPWTWIVEDRFAFMDREGHVSFRRGERGHITGYVLDFPRAENILFEKIN